MDHTTPLWTLATVRVVAVLLLLLAPAARSDGYTDVSASRDARVDCGSGGTDVPTDWYFPQPNGSRDALDRIQ